MIATLMTFPYAKFRNDGEECLILGFNEVEGLPMPVRAIVASVKTGEISVVDIKQVDIDVARLKKL